MKKLLAMLTAASFVCVFGLIASGASPKLVTVSKSEDVKDHRSMSTDATIFKNDVLTVSTVSHSDKRNGGLKGHSLFVVCVDEKGNAIWVTKPFYCTTIGGRNDLFTPSTHRDAFVEELPTAIGKYTVELQIYHNAGDVAQDRDAQVRTVKKAIKAAKEIVLEVKEAVEELK